MKFFLTFLFTLICVASFAQTPLTGLYKGIGGESYLSIKEKKGEIEGVIYEKGKEPLTLQGFLTSDSLKGTIWLNIVTERKWIGEYDDSLFTLKVFVPQDTTVSIVAMSFIKVSQKSNIKPEKLFGSDVTLPKELAGIWVSYDFNLKKETGFRLLKNGILEAVGSSAAEELAKNGLTSKDLQGINIISNWFVKNNRTIHLATFLNGQKMNEISSLYKLEGDKLTLISQNNSPDGVYYRKEDKKK